MAIGNYHGGQASRQSSPFTLFGQRSVIFGSYMVLTYLLQEMLCSPLITQSLAAAAAALITCICRRLPRGIR